MPKKLRAGADYYIRSRPRNFDDIIGDQAMPALNQIKRISVMKLERLIHI